LIYLFLKQKVGVQGSRQPVMGLGTWIKLLLRPSSAILAPLASYRALLGLG
jgi:hypothetical protein